MGAWHGKRTEGSAGSELSPPLRLGGPANHPSRPGCGDGEAPHLAGLLRGGPWTSARAQAGDVSARPAEGAAETTRRGAVKPPAFDGLHCFETVVMPARSSH